MRLRYVSIVICFVILAAGCSIIMTGCGKSDAEKEKTEFEKVKEELEKKIKAEEYSKSYNTGWNAARAEYKKKEDELEKSYKTKREELEELFKKKNDALDKRETNLNEREKAFAKQLEGLELLIRQADQAKKEAEGKKKEVQGLIDEEVKKLLEQRKVSLQEIREKKERELSLKRKEFASLDKAVRTAPTQSYQNKVMADLDRKADEIVEGEKVLKEKLKNEEERFDVVIRRFKSLSL